MNHTSGTMRGTRLTLRLALVLCLAVAFVAIPAVALAAPVTTSDASTYTITASAGVGGSISPFGVQEVASGASSPLFVITADLGYEVANVIVDGVSLGERSSFQFTNVTQDHTISVVFAADAVTFTITASAGAGGAIAPSGAQVVAAGSNVAFTITANSGFHVAGVLVDGVSVGAVGSYTFANVDADHTISANFAANVAATSITIKTSGTTAVIGNTRTLSGVVTPFVMVGHNIQVMVKKPGKSYFSYSSLRTVYNLAGAGAWLYKYYFKAGMTKGIYTFYAFVPASPGFLYSRSPNLTIRLR